MGLQNTPTAFLQRSKTHQRMIWKWRKTIWLWSYSNAGALGNLEYPFTAIAPESTLARSRSTAYGSNSTKLCTYASLYQKTYHIYTYRERERERETDRQTERETERERERERERESREIEGEKNTEIDVLYFV